MMQIPMVVEHWLGHGPSQKRNISKLYAALLINENTFKEMEGHLADDRLANIPTSLGVTWMVYMVLQFGRRHQRGYCLKLQRIYARS